jgi:hypothetical protein
MKGVMTRKIFEHKKRIHIKLDEEPIIENNINSLIAHLYRPCEEDGYAIDKDKINEYGLNTSAVNWGDMCVTEVKKIEKENKYLVYVEEADPGATALKEYLEGWMKKWGWDVEVILGW